MCRQTLPLWWRMALWQCCTHSLSFHPMRCVSKDWPHCQCGILCPFRWEWPFARPKRYFAEFSNCSEAVCSKQRKFILVLTNIDCFRPTSLTAWIHSGTLSISHANVTSNRISVGANAWDASAASFLVRKMPFRHEMFDSMDYCLPRAIQYQNFDCNRLQSVCLRKSDVVSSATFSSAEIEQET